MSAEVLHHLGIPLTDIPKAVVIVEEAVLRRASCAVVDGSEVRRREYRSGRFSEAPQVLLCSGAFGAPASVIALEELVRSGVTTVVSVSQCRCSSCEKRSGSGHDVVIPFGAVRGEGTSIAYAPLEFPAVPDHALYRSVLDAAQPATSTVVETVDVAPQWLPQHTNLRGGPPIDLQTSALMVVAAAAGVALAAVVVGSGDEAETALSAGLLSRVASAAQQEVDRRG